MIGKFSPPSVDLSIAQSQFLGQLFLLESYIAAVIIFLESSQNSQNVITLYGVHSPPHHSPIGVFCTYYPSTQALRLCTVAKP